jgi:adenine-specific DNA-methyltransferase
MGAREMFQYPKSPYAVKDCILAGTNKKDAIILDFFAGSGTTAQAVLELNKEDGGNRQFILCTNNENNICTDVCYPRIKKVIEGYKNLKGEWAEGLGGNLKYFKTDFVDAEPTDKNKIKLTKQAIEMLCIKEGTFELVQDKDSFKIFKNNKHYTGIIFDQAAISEFKKTIENIDRSFSVYVFSLSDETFDEEFSDVRQKVKLSPIPEAILRVYRGIFK